MSENGLPVEVCCLFGEFVVMTIRQRMLLFLKADSGREM